MSGDGVKCVILCESVHDVMALERALKDAGIAAEMIPTPRELTSDCGMALQISRADAERTGKVRTSASLRWLGLYVRNDQGFSRIAESGSD